MKYIIKWDDLNYLGDASNGVINWVPKEDARRVDHKETAAFLARKLNATIEEVEE